MPGFEAALHSPTPAADESRYSVAVRRALTRAAKGIDPTTVRSSECLHVERFGRIARRSSTFQPGRLLRRWFDAGWSDSTRSTSRFSTLIACISHYPFRLVRRHSIRVQRLTGQALAYIIEGSRRFSQPRCCHRSSTVKRTFQPSKIKRARTHGFRARLATRGGRAVLTARRRKGRARLSA